MQEQAYLNKYHFEHDPFSTRVPKMKFFAPGRKSVIAKLHTFAKYNQSINAVTGPYGSGKSILRQAFVASLVINTDIVHIGLAGVHVADELSLINQIALECKVQSHINAIVEHLNVLNKADKQLYLSIDDAHLLTSDALEILVDIIDMTEDNAPSIFLFASDDIVPRLHKISKLMGAYDLFKIIELLPYTASETQEYIELRLQTVDRAVKSLFDDVEIATIHKKSHGWPGLINEYARKILIEDIETEAGFEFSIDYILSMFPSGFMDNIVNIITIIKRFFRTLPMLHLIVLISTALFILSLLFLDSNNKTNIADTDIVQDGSIVEMQQNSPYTGNDITKRGGNEYDLVSSYEPTNATQSTNNEANVTNNNNNLYGKPFILDSSGDAVVDAPVQAPKKLDDNNKNAQNSKDKKNTEISITSKQPQSEIKSSVAKSSPTPKTQLSSSVSNKLPTQAKQIIKNLNTGSNVANWYLSQSNSVWVIQVMSTTSEQIARQTIARDNKLRYYKKNVDGVDYYSITYGSFASQEEAKAAIGNLPWDLRRTDPWVRKIEQLKKEVKIN